MLYGGRYSTGTGRKMATFRNLKGVWVLGRLKLPKQERFEDGKRQLLEPSVHRRLVAMFISSSCTELFVRQSFCRLILSTVISVI